MIRGSGWWYDLMTGSSELKLEGRNRDAQKEAVGGKEDPVPSPHSVILWPWAKTLPAWEVAGKTVFRGQSGGYHRNVKGAVRTPVTSLMKGPGTRKERETGVKECLGLRGEDSAHCQYCSSLCWRSQSTGKHQKEEWERNTLSSGSIIVYWENIKEY